MWFTRLRKKKPTTKLHKDWEASSRDGYKLFIYSQENSHNLMVPEKRPTEPRKSWGRTVAWPL